MGGGGKGGTTTQTVSIPPEVLARYNAVNTRAEAVANTPFQEYSKDPNAFVAPLTPTQQAGIANTNQAAGMAQPYYGAATGMTMAGSQSVGQLTPEQINKYQNPYTQAVADTTFQNLRQQQAQEMQGATGNAIRAGAFGGDRSGLVAANLARQQQQGTAQAMAPIYQQGYQNAVQTAQGQQAVTAADLARLQQGGQQIAGLGSGAQGAALQGAQAQLAAGQTQQQTAQAGKAALYNQFLQEQGYPFQIAQFLANIAEGTGALSGSTTTTQAPGGFFSDERLKENIRKIGETNDGQPIYKYNYKGEPRTQIGLLAQDVEKHHPDAVGHQQGYKTVDYDKATENSEGGAVHQFNAREGFDLGGSAAFDPNMVKEILRRQVEMYQQQGTPGGGKSPGQAGYMPATPALPANISIARPAQAPQQQQSGLAQAVQTSRGITEGLGMAEGAKTKLFGGTDAKGKPVAGWLDRSEEADKLRAAQDAAEKKALEEASKGAAHGGLITGPRMKYAMGGLPYGDEEATKKGYMGQLSYDMPSPAALKGEQDAMRAGKLPDHPQSGLGEAAGAASKLYSGTKMASAAYDKAASMLSGATPAGELATKYPAAPAGTPMPAARPEGLGLTTPAAEAAPVTEGLATAAPVTEGVAAAAPVAEGLAAAAPVAETAALAAPAAEGAASLAELLPFVFLKRGGVAGREHHDGSEGNVVGPPPSDTPVADELRRMREQREQQEANPPAPATAPITAPATASTKADVYSQLHPEFAPIMKRIIERANEEGIPVTPGSFYRSKEEQAKILADKQAGRRGAYQSLPVASPDTSLHPQRFAGDVGGLKPQHYDRFGQIVREEGGEWGGDWKTPDWLHVQLPRDKRETASAYVAPEGGLPNSDVIKSAFKNVKDVPAAVEGGLGSVKQSLSDAGDYYTKNREHIIPVIAGLGSMLASNRPNLGQAIGEGLVGYGTSAADMMKRAADVRNTEQSTEAVRAETASGAFKVDANGTARVRYKKPNGDYGFMYESEYRALSPAERDAVDIDPNARKQMDEHLASKGAKAPPPSGLVPPPAGTTTIAEPKTGLVPAGTAKPAATPFDVSEEDRAAAIKEAQKYVTNPRNAAGIEDVFTPQQKIAIGARQQERLLHEFGAGLSALPREKSLLVTGSTSEGAIKIAKALNTVVPMIGGQAVVNPADVTTAENVRKTLEQLKKNAQDSGNLKALGIYQALEESLPSSTQTFGGAAKNFSQAAVNTRREIDKDNYFRQWQQTAAGPRNEYVDIANRTGTGLDERFNKKTAAQYEKEMAALQKMYTEYVPGTKSDSGRPMTYYQYLVKHASELSPKEQQVVAQKFGAPHILRYFPSSGQ
jgi:hypothetical protein